MAIAYTPYRLSPNTFGGGSLRNPVKEYSRAQAPQIERHAAARVAQLRAMAARAIVGVLSPVSTCAVSRAPAPSPA
jgi:hypothetical protein